MKRNTTPALAVVGAMLLGVSMPAADARQLAGPVNHGAFGAAPTPMLQPPADPTAPAADAKATARRNVQTLRVPSKRLDKEIPINLLLPKGYATSARRYPVLYLLHGSYGGYKDWNDSTGVAAYVAELPLIVVMPDANGNSRYINSPGLGRYQDFFLTELVPYIDANYRTLGAREGRALAGLSMGGYGAWRIALDAPGTFAAAASLSGSFNWGEGDFDAEQVKQRAVPLYGGDGPEQRKLYAADRILLHIDKNIKNGMYVGPALRFDIGTDDNLVTANRRTRDQLGERKVPFEYAEYPGAHTWTYWDAHLRDALPFLLRHLRQPAR